MRVDPEVLRFLESRETPCVGQADDLKIDTEVGRGLPARVWLSRIGVSDGAARNNDVSIEVWNVREGKWIEYSSLSNSIVRAWFTEALRSAGYSGGGL